MSCAVPQRHALSFLAAIFAALLPAVALAQQTDLAGDWFLTLNERRAVHTGILTIERAGDSLVAFVDGGPASFEVHGDAMFRAFDFSPRKLVAIKAIHCRKIRASQRCFGRKRVHYGVEPVSDY